MVQGVNAGGETAVETEDLVVHQSCEGQIVKQVSEILPHIGIAVFAQALVIEPVHLQVTTLFSSVMIKGFSHLSNLSRLVIATKDGDSFPESNL